MSTSQSSSPVHTHPKKDYDKLQYLLEGPHSRYTKVHISCLKYAQCNTHAWYTLHTLGMKHTFIFAELGYRVSHLASHFNSIF